jgi:hypothetical protein
MADPDLLAFGNDIYDADQTLRSLGVPNHTDKPIEGVVWEISCSYCVEMPDLPSALTNYRQIRVVFGGDDDEGRLRRFILDVLTKTDKVKIISNSRKSLQIMYVYRQSCKL